MIDCPMCGHDLAHLEAEWWRCHACGYLHRDVEVKPRPVVEAQPAWCTTCGIEIDRALVPRSERCQRCQMTHRYQLVLAWQAVNRHGTCEVCGGQTAWKKYTRCRRCWARSRAVAR